MAIGIYLKWRIARFTSAIRKDMKDPLTFITAFIILVVVAFFRDDIYSIIASIIALVLLWIYADYRKGEHMHWYRQEYRKIGKKTEEKNNGKSQDNSDDRDEGNTVP